MLKKLSFLKTVNTIILVLVLNLIGFSQILEPVKWEFSSRKISENEAELIFTAKIENKWHLYSQDIPMTPPATTFTFSENGKYELIGEVTESESIEEYDSNFEMNLKYFSDKAIFKQKIKLLSGSPFTIKGFVTFMCCDNTRCLPPTDVDFEFKFSGIEQAFADSKPQEPEKVKDIGKDYESELKEEKSEELIRESIKISTTASESRSESLWIFFIIALLAGFVGALTPCVYPMIPMTVTFFMNSSKNKIRAKTNALFYGLSIIVIYTFIGVLVTVLFGSESIKNISSNWITNIIFFLLFTVFAASFFGLFEFVLPSSLTNKSDKQADKGGLIGTFFMALTLVLVSFSCTAPFVGGILVEASTGSIIKPTIGMFGFSLAFALPFTVLAFFPSWLNKLPKSGGWLNSVKVVLGFIILALGMKFLLVPNQALGWGITREFFIAVWIVLFTLLGFYLLGKIKFAYDSDINYIGVPRLLLIIITFTFVVYLIPGMFGAPLKAVSGFLPSESSFNLIEIISKSKGSAVSSDYKSNICEEPKYADLFKLPHGLQGYFDYEQGLACAEELNKPILLDFKGHACANCKVMEKTVWSDPEVLKRLSEDYVIIALYVDDRTELPESEWVTSTVDGKVKKTIGRKNTDFQISRFNVNAQPYYVLLDHNEGLLVEPRAYDKDIDEFVDFLDNGVREFEKRQE
ncbi:MAG: thioredoxin family protein [Bacteroidetes bacterium]|nr:thioredoxin family protein [Bacteroidota bacterium]